ncbi:hypothetical protein K8I61_08170 [bacterium]|nr:hypothetical protein [bacterium]
MPSDRIRKTTGAPFVIAGFLAVFALAFLAGCDAGDGPEADLTDDEMEDFENPGGEGPEVLFEPDASPVSLIPQPNDLLTREDPTTVTGRRVNVPIEGPSDFIRELRRRLRGLDGFGTFQNIVVSFSEPIDLKTVGDKTVYLVNVDPRSEGYGELVTLDLGKGFFPKNLLNTEGFFTNDEMKDADSAIYAPGNRVDWYEDETNTLMIRPLLPLRQSTTYAIVLTEALLGEDGEPVRAPEYFTHVTFPTQRDALVDAADILVQSRGVRRDEIAFAWQFTTMTITQPLEVLREGLYGRGPFAWITDELWPKLTTIHDFSIEVQENKTPNVLDASYFAKLLAFVDLLLGEGTVPLGVMIPLENVDYIVSGSYTTLSFLETKDRVFNVDFDTGEAEYEPEEVTFFIAIPKETAQHKQPFPVSFFQHANVRNRLDIIAIADALAKEGIATIGIDAAEHGPESYVNALFYVLEGLTRRDLGNASEFPTKLIAGLILGVFYPSIDTSGMDAEEMMHVMREQTFLGALLHGRAVDTQNDGLPFSGASFYSADIFRTVDISRQTVFDLMQGVRVIRHMGEDWNGNGEIDQVEGDFDGNGVVDIDPDAPIYFTGMSLGSILGIPFVTIEPEIKTAVFNVPGGGLTDVLLRTTIPNINTSIRTDLVGPVVIGQPDPHTGDVAVTISLEPASNPFAHVVLHPGARVTLRNQDSNEFADEIMDELGNFSLAVAADKGDMMRLTVADPASGDVLDEVEWSSRYRGLGVPRNTPEARSFIDTAQWAVTLSDPVGFAPHLFLRPLPGREPRAFLMQMCSPDTAIPLNNGAAIARAAGVMDFEHADNLRELGAFQDHRISFKAANYPLQSHADQAWRVHPAFNHEYLLAPRADPYSIMYSIAGRAQAAAFLASNGENVIDNLMLLVPPEWRAVPLDPENHF